jgi:putative arginine-specific protease argI polyprotein
MKTNIFYSYILILAAVLWHTQARAEKYVVEIGGVELTSDNYKNITAAGGFPAVKKGKITYDHTTRVLTLNNAIIKPKEGTPGIDMFIDYTFKDRPLIIKLIGHNVIDVTGNAEGINTLKSSVRITGNGTLDISANAGIVPGGDLTIDGGCAIDCKAIVSADNVIIDDAQLHAICRDWRPAVRAFQHIVLKGGSYVASPQGATYHSWPGTWENYFEKDGVSCKDLLIKRGKNTDINRIPLAPVHKPDAIYTLDGQQMQQPFEQLPKGVYIVNGKKKMKR